MVRSVFASRKSARRRGCLAVIRASTVLTCLRIVATNSWVRSWHMPSKKPKDLGKSSGGQLHLLAVEPFDWLAATLQLCPDEHSNSMLLELTMSVNGRVSRLDRCDRLQKWYVCRRIGRFIAHSVAQALISACDFVLHVAVRDACKLSAKWYTVCMCVCSQSFSVWPLRCLVITWCIISVSWHAWTWTVCPLNVVLCRSLFFNYICIAHLFVNDHFEWHMHQSHISSWSCCTCWHLLAASSLSLLE